MGKERVLVTGAAGFIGFHFTAYLLGQGYIVAGIDNINDYYDTGIKYGRLNILSGKPGFQFYKIDITDNKSLNALFSKNAFDYVVHLAAQAGVRYSIDRPDAFVHANLVGFANMLEVCRQHRPKHFLYASSSSVYGGSLRVPFSPGDPSDHPMSLYAATKKSGELMAHAYSHLYGIPTTGMRFFTVYGPWGRPDMAYFLFADAIRKNKPIKVFNHGNMERDFTYVGDVTAAMEKLMHKIPVCDDSWNDIDGDNSASSAPYKIYNIGHNKPVALGEMIAAIEAALGRQAVKEYVGMQPGDVPVTCADTGDLQKAIGYAPQTDIKAGIGRFAAWYKVYYKMD